MLLAALQKLVASGDVVKLAKAGLLVRNLNEITKMSRDHILHYIIYYIHDMDHGSLDIVSRNHVPYHISMIWYFNLNP